MRLNSKVTWGLAWTGLALVLAVPSADFLTGRLASANSPAAVLTSDIDPVTTETAIPVKTTKVTTVKTKDGVIITPAGSRPPSDPVDTLLSKGKPLPDYISDGKTPAPAETQVASVDPVAPTPFPVWARPKLGAPAAAPLAVTPEEPTVIVDETTLTGSIADPARPVPPAPIVDDSANWDSESLREYLARRGLLEDDGRSSATVTQRPAREYDPDGFYLSDGPNNERLTRRERILRMLEEEGGDPSEFTLF
jgi:hypothetical protein